jgi:hypothetical protein
MEFLKSNWANIIGLILATFSIIYSILESRKNKKIMKLIRFNNWIMYQRLCNLGGTVQKSLNKAQTNNINNDFFEEIVRSDTLCAELMKEAIRLIYTYEPSFTQEDIDKWVSEGKITAGYADIFKKFMITDK